MSQTFRSSSSLAGRSVHFLLRLPLGRADVDQGLQRVLDDRLGQAAGRVVRAARSPIRPSRDEDAPRADHHGPVRNVSLRTRPENGGTAGSNGRTRHRSRVGSRVRRGSPDPAVGRTEGLPVPAHGDLRSARWQGRETLLRHADLATAPPLSAPQATWSFLAASPTTGPGQRFLRGHCPMPRRLLPEELEQVGLPLSPRAAPIPRERPRARPPWRRSS